MAQESEKSIDATVSPAVLHKGSGLAVDDAKWFIAECKPTKERTIRQLLQKADYEVYVASQKEEKVYASRNRRTVEKIIIPGKVFVRTAESQLWTILSTYTSIRRFMVDRFASDREKAKRVFAWVPDAEMQRMQYVLDHATKPVMITTDMLSVGQPIEVTRGPLIGLKGELARIENATYIVLKMEMGERHYIYTEISIEDVSVV